MKQTRRSKYKKPSNSSSSDSRTPIFHDLTAGTQRWIAAIVFFALAVIFVLAALGVAGVVGDWFLKFFVTIFGLLGYFSPIAFVWIAYILMSGSGDSREGLTHITTRRVVLGVLISWFGAAGLLHVLFSFGGSSVWSVASSGTGGGFVGAVAAYIFLSLLGSWAALFILTAILVVGFMITANSSGQCSVDSRSNQRVRRIPERNR